MNLEKLLRNKFVYEQLIRNVYPSKAELGDRISEWLLLSSSSGKSDISDSTVKRDLKDVEELFHVTVEYSTVERGYYISEPEENSDISDVLESLNLFFIKKNIPDAVKHIRLEPRKAKGTEYFFDIIKAIEKRQKIRFLYTHYKRKESAVRKVSPLGLKEFKGFWYLVCLDGEIIKTFGLDRISSLSLDMEKAAYPKEFSMEKHFEHCYGIVNFLDEEPQEVILKMKPIKGYFYKANPLHHSQKIIEETDNYTIMSLFIKFTYDLKQELRSHAKGELEVIKPENGLFEDERYY